MFAHEVNGHVPLCQDRPTELIPRLRGVLTNPNCEFYPNFVALHTLASWCKAPADGEQRDVEMGESAATSSVCLLSICLSCVCTSK